MLGVVVAVIAVMSCNCCETYYYARAVKKEAEEVFKDKKSFFQALSFKGVVVGKEKCEKCGINKFVVFIEIEEMNQDVPFKYQAYPPYYFFKRDSLSLTVIEEAFEDLKKGDLMKKKSNSRYLETNNGRLEILNKEESVWLP